MKQPLELAEASTGGLLQGLGDLAVGEARASEELPHLGRLHHGLQTPAGTVGQLGLEDNTGSDQLHQHHFGSGLLVLGQVDQQRLRSLGGHERLQGQPKLEQARPRQGPVHRHVAQLDGAEATRLRYLRGHLIEERPKFGGRIKNEHHAPVAQLFGQASCQQLKQLVGSRHRHGSGGEPADQHPLGWGPGSGRYAQITRMRVKIRARLKSAHMPGPGR